MRLRSLAMATAFALGSFGVGDSAMAASSVPGQSASTPPIKQAASSSGTDIWLLIVVAVVVGVLGILVGWLWGRAGRRSGPATAPKAVPRPPERTVSAPIVPAPPVPDWRLDGLAEEVIAVRDLTADAGLSTRLGSALAAVGYQSFDPVGLRFDPNFHRAVDFEPSPAAEASGQIAMTERVGYTSAGRLVRAADVVVFRPTAPIPAPGAPTPEAGR
jgi:hypothetical protein